MFFDERVTTLWCFGAVLIVVGMWLLSSVAIIEQDQSSEGTDGKKER